MASTKTMSPLERIGAKPAAAKANRSAAKPTAKRRQMILAGIGLAAVVGLAIWIVAHFGKDNRMAELSDLRARLLDPSITQQDRQEILDEIRRIQQSLMPEVQKKAADGAAAFTQLMSAHVRQILALPADQRMAAVDRDIDMMRSMGMAFGGRGANSKQDPSQNSAGGRTGGWGQGTDAQRNAFRNQMLSAIPAETRAEMQTYMQLMQVRRIQRGM